VKGDKNKLFLRPCKSFAVKKLQKQISKGA